MKTDIKENLSKSEHYPTSTDIRGEWVPRTVKQFLKYFTDSKVKQESIGQCLVKLITPTVIPPILFGLSVELENLFGSRWLLDELFQLGFGISYSEVTRFKPSCASNEDSSLNIDRISQESSFTQFIADNVDHNTATLDGSGTFHGMGILASTVGEGKFNMDKVKVKRIKKLLSIEELIKICPPIKIQEYTAPVRSTFLKIQLRPMIQLMFPYTLPKCMNADFSWKLSKWDSSIIPLFQIGLDTCI